MVAGVPAHVDGRMLAITAATPAPRSSTRTGCGTTSRASATGTRSGRTTASGSSPAPRRCGSTRPGERLPAPYLPGLRHPRHARRASAGDRLRLLVVRAHPEDHREGVRAVGLRAEPRPDRQGRQAAARPGASATVRPGPVEAFKQHGEDFVVADTLAELVAGMNRVGGPSRAARSSTRQTLRRQIEARDRQIDNAYSKDTQVTFIRQHRTYRGDKLVRVASPHQILDPANGPLIAVRLNILTRKTLGGLRHRPRRPLPAPRPASRCPASTPRARSTASAAAGCTATTRSRAPSSAAASSPGVRRAARPPLPSAETARWG